MAATPAQRSMRISRSDSTKKEVPTRRQSIASTPKKVKKEEETVDKGVDGIPKEVQSEPPVVERKESALVASPPVQEVSETPSTAQPRRSMTRARKPSSRLLPSPSPPPSRNSSHYHYHNKAATPSTTTSATMSASSGSTSKNTQKKQQPANTRQLSTTMTTAASEPVITIATGSTSPSGEHEGFGPGKRKRRPSTMTKPPSTIVKSTIVAPFQQGNNPAGTTSTGSTLKVRINRVASKSLSPEEKAAGSHEKISKKTKAAGDTAGNLASSSFSTQTSSTNHPSKATEGYESDGNAEGARLMALSEVDGDAEHDEDSDAGLASMRRKKLVNGARNRLKQNLEAAREKFGARRWPTSNGVTLEPPPLISRRGGLKAHQGGFTHGLQRPSKQGSNEGNHLRSQSTSVLDGKWTWTPSGIAPTLRFRLANTAGDDEVSEASDLDEEDDFHVAMLDGGDFGEPHLRKAASLSSKSSHRDSKSGEDSDTEDTPATTPRSPQSTCDLPERRWSTGVDEEEKTQQTKGRKDAVFAHALEPSSRRPHTHAGSLTLSLPFDEMDQVTEEEEAERKSRIRRDIGQDVLRTGVEEDGSLAANLLSPAVHPSILGLSSKQHSLMMSSPHSNSAFTSPAFEASVPGVKSEPLPLSLPPPAMLSKSESNGITENEGQTRQEAGIRRISSAASTMRTSDDDEEKTYEHAALAMEPPERMCLSELDRAWEQSEYLTKARSLAGRDVDEEADSERDVEVNMVEAVAHDEEQEEEQEQELEENSPKAKGIKRASLRTNKEEGATKKSKASPKHKSPPSSRMSRRSTRQSGVKA